MPAAYPQAVREPAREHVRAMPDDAVAPPARKDSHAPDPVDYVTDANDLIEEIARRFEAFSNELLNPRVLAAIAETVP